MARPVRRHHGGQGLTVRTDQEGAGAAGDRATRRRLLAALVEHHPWLGDADLGPATVDAGACDRCGEQPRLVATCGPVAWRALCRDCLVAVGNDAFCAGHVETGEQAFDLARSLPTTWATLVHLSWVASGQLEADPAWLRLAANELARPRLQALVADAAQR